jgi:hypothetical protein
MTKNNTLNWPITWNILLSSQCFELKVIVNLTMYANSFFVRAYAAVYGSQSDFQDLPGEQDPRCSSVHYSGTNGHLGRTADVPQASWIASWHKRSQIPCRVSDPQRWGAGSLKSTTLNTRHNGLIASGLFVIIPSP